MSDEPRTAWPKIGPQLLGIVALAAIFVSAVQSDPATKPVRMSFEEIGRHLQVGMSMDEVHAMIFGAGGHCRCIAGSTYSWWSDYVDSGGEYELSVCSEQKGNILKGQYDARLVEWHLHRR